MQINHILILLDEGHLNDLLCFVALDQVRIEMRFSIFDRGKLATDLAEWVEKPVIFLLSVHNQCF